MDNRKNNAINHYDMNKVDTLKITMDMDKIKQVSLSHKDALLVVDDKVFLDIRCHIPRSPNKYIAAWRYLTGKEYY